MKTYIAVLATAPLRSLRLALGSAVVGLGLVASATSASAATFNVTYEAPGVLNSTATFSSSGVETFDSRPIADGQSFNTDFGTGGVISGAYTGVDIRAANQYGGASASNFASIASSQGYSLALSTTDPRGINYFGFWLSALDGGNNLAFYKAGVLQFTFNAGDVTTLLAGKPAYAGNPNAPFEGANANQPYAFLNFYDTDGTFDQVVFSEAPQIGGYESDNHTVGFFTSQGGTPIAVPEPTSWALMLLGFGGLGSVLRARRRLLVAA